MAYDNSEICDGGPVRIVAGIDSRSELFHASELNWRPEGKSGDIPQSVYVARLSMLGDGDRAAVEREFSEGKRGREFKRLFFGGDVYGSDYRNDAAVMMGCAAAGGDAEGALRIFRASASFDAVRYDDGAVVGFYGDGRPILRDETAKFRSLAKRAAEIVGEYRERLGTIRKDMTPRDVAKGSKAMESERGL